VQNENSISSVLIYGAGKVGSMMANAVLSKGYNLVDIISKSGSSADKLKKQLGLKEDRTMEVGYNKVDLIILAVPDDEIANLINQLPDYVKTIMVHTSGSVGMDVFHGKSSNYGILYPLQTFHPLNLVDIKQVPICIEASDILTLEKISGFASSLSNHIYHLDSEQRRIAHIAAVFAGNFSNLMYDIAFDILEDNDLPPELIRPLILETAQRIQTQSPKLVQTGPASRLDLETIKKHLDMLEGKKGYKDIYTLISKLIIKKKYDKDVDL
jgi:predicted short-subunit dehydrogenase-like oxidoreductase (DUF2520 family)